MARPLWSDAGSDPQAVADRLDQLAETAKELRFEPRPLPPGIDRKVLHQAAVLRARRQLTSAHGELDRILAQEVRAIDDLVRSANLLVERLREWYGLHAPEAVRAADPKDLARLVADNDRAGVLAALDLAEMSLGTDLDPADGAVVQGFAGALRAVHDSWAALERRVEDLMREVAPNLTHVVGPVLGARLIAQSGSLQRLAGFPAGTIQTLGAETALFRHIKEGTKPPKHGILFQHPRVHQAPPWQRGPIARALALHASLAARADAFTQNDLTALLTERLEDDLARIARDRPKPPRPQRGPPGRGPPRGPPRGPAKPYGKPAGKPYGKPGDKPYRKPGDKPYRKPGGKPYGKPGGKPTGPPRRKGPGAFRNQGDGPARPPGGSR